MRGVCLVEFFFFSPPDEWSTLENCTQMNILDFHPYQNNVPHFQQKKKRFCKISWIRVALWYWQDNLCEGIYFFFFDQHARAFKLNLFNKWWYSTVSHAKCIFIRQNTQRHSLREIFSWYLLMLGSLMMYNCSYMSFFAAMSLFGELVSGLLKNFGMKIL